MRNIGSKKRFAIVASTVAAVLIGTGVAVAYWTTTGTGTGSASTASDTGVDVHSDAVTGLYPGIAPQPIKLYIDNDGPSAQYVTAVDVEVTGTSDDDCDPADFVVTDGTIGADVPVGPNNVYGASGATITMTNTTDNQDACKNATIDLSFDAS